MVSAEKNEKDFPTEWKNFALGIAIAHAQLTYRIEAKVERVLAASVDDANALELTRLHAENGLVLAVDLRGSANTVRTQ